MFNYQFGGNLTLPQIDRIRWYLFPEIRIDDDGQADLFAPDKEGAESPGDNLPDLIKIMDIQQEQLARSLGEGHRVIHGVAGSGKTLILGYRCLHLSQVMSKPILVLCFNIALAAKLRAFIASKGIGGQVQVYHFHDWCGQQIKTYHIEMLISERPYWDRLVDTVIHAVETGQIPRAQYGALLIDEGNDFKAEWLKLVTQMVDPESDSVLLLYDDAQSIYKSRSGLGFSLSSVGIKAQGRTTVLKANYRNTREILDFAYTFAREYIDPLNADDDHIPLIEPMAAGNQGLKPALRAFECLPEEIRYTAACLKKWNEQGVPWGDMAVLYAAKYQGEMLVAELKRASIPHLWLSTKKEKAAYQPILEQVSILTIHSSKGLEFPRVIMLGVGQLSDDERQRPQRARLLYVGMTRAMECLLITTSGDNRFSRKLADVAGQK
jgi:superfamily I DNA/RNA helicase